MKDKIRGKPHLLCNPLKPNTHFFRSKNANIHRNKTQKKNEIKTQRALR